MSDPGSPGWRPSWAQVGRPYTLTFEEFSAQQRQRLGAAQVDASQAVAALRRFAVEVERLAEPLRVAGAALAKVRVDTPAD